MCSPGWTEAEYTSAVGRLHMRVLDLEDALRVAKQGVASQAAVAESYGVQLLKAREAFREIDLRTAGRRGDLGAVGKIAREALFGIRDD